MPSAAGGSTGPALSRGSAGASWRDWCLSHILAVGQELGGGPEPQPSRQRGLPSTRREVSQVPGPAVLQVGGGAGDRRAGVELGHHLSCLEGMGPGPGDGQALGCLRKSCVKLFSWRMGHTSREQRGSARLMLGSGKWALRAHHSFSPVQTPFCPGQPAGPLVCPGLASHRGIAGDKGLDASSVLWRRFWEPP